MIDSYSLPLVCIEGELYMFSYDVVILSYNTSDKVKVLKCFRDNIPGLSLNDAKHIIEHLSAVTNECVGYYDALKLKKKFEEAGCVVKLERC